jgi:cell division septation protein DedD
MNDHNLDDLIIGDPSPVGKKSKSLLAIIALIVIILLVGILLSKMILGTSEDEIKLSENNQTEFVSPELIPVDSNDNKKKNSDLTPITKEKLPKPSKNSGTPVKTKPKKEVRTVAKKSESAKKTPAKKEPTKAATKEKVSQAEPSTKEPAKKQSKPSALFGEGKPAYYIQIGAFNREPNAKFIKKIENAGLKYTVHKNEKTRRVRVGPYDSYAEAKAALTDVNSSIGIMGFVVKQK